MAELWKYSQQTLEIKQNLVFWPQIHSFRPENLPNLILWKVYCQPDNSEREEEGGVKFNSYVYTHSGVPYNYWVK